MPHVALKDLPHALRERLQNWLNGADGAIVFSEPSSFAPLAAAALSSIWLIVLFAMSYGFRWSLPMIVVCGIATCVAGYFVARGALDVVRRLRQESGDSFVVTRGYVFEFRGGEVEYRSLESLVTVQENHKYENGDYRWTDITFAFDGGVSRTVRITDATAAENAVEKAAIYKKEFFEAAARGDRPDLVLEREISEFARSPSRTPVINLRGSLIPAVGALLIASLAMVVAVFANDYFDDIKSWDVARTTDRASSYRQYIRTQPNGRWSQDAKSRLQSIYESAESSYRASLNEGHDKDAVEAISSILRYARDTGNFQVNVVFDRRAEISESLIDEIKEDFGVKNVLPLGNSFSNEKMIARESALVGVLNEALRQVFPDDVLEFTHECAAECAEASIVYSTSFRDSIYYSTEEKHLPEEDRIWKPGILIDWTFRVSIPRETEAYEFGLESVPAATIHHDSPVLMDVTPPAGPGDMTEAEKTSFYDAMVASAFDHFRRNLVFKIGIGPEPPPQIEQEDSNPDSTPVKTSDVSVSRSPA